jgi:hypothetical protein
MVSPGPFHSETWLSGNCRGTQKIAADIYLVYPAVSKVFPFRLYHIVEVVQVYAAKVVASANYVLL